MTLTDFERGPDGIIHNLPPELRQPTPEEQEVTENAISARREAIINHAITAHFEGIVFGGGAD